MMVVSGQSSVGALKVLTSKKVAALSKPKESPPFTGDDEAQLKSVTNATQSGVCFFKMKS
jgi:hypothetical protein